jgi:hypothetical protein
LTDWRHHIWLGDVFHDDSLSFEERRDAIVARLREDTWIADHDSPPFKARQAIGKMSDAEESDAFDAAWDLMYDWADQNKCWIDTFASGPRT